MLHNPLVSIVIPCYNHEQYVTECILSVVNQTYQNIELIVIDDGSKDSSSQRIEELLKQYRFTFIRQKNQGLVRTLNSAIQRHVAGEYVCSVASDDFWPLDKLSIQLEYMERNPQISICCGNAIFVNEQSHILTDRTHLLYIEKDYSFEDIFRRNTIPALTVMTRRSVFDKIGFYDQSIGIEDWPFWLKALDNGYKIHHINRLLGYYRVISTSMSRNPSFFFKEASKIVDKYRSKHPHIASMKMRELADKYHRDMLWHLYERKCKCQILQFIVSKPHRLLFSLRVVARMLRGLKSFT